MVSFIPTILSDSILKSHQFLAQTIVNVCSSLLEDGRGEVNSTDVQPDPDLVTKQCETALNDHAANLLKLISGHHVGSLPSDGSVPCVGK